MKNKIATTILVVIIVALGAAIWWVSRTSTDGESDGTTPTTTVTETPLPTELDTTTPTVSGSVTPSASGTVTPTASTQPKSHAVSLTSMSFSPATLTVKKGDTVVWTNNDGVAHTVTANNGSFDSGNLDNGKTFSFTFTATGEFNYNCTIHPTMQGKVIVQN